VIDTRELTGCKCIRDGKQCVFLAAKPRPKLAKNSRVYVSLGTYLTLLADWDFQRRVAEMEQRLDGILALLSSNPQNSKDAPAAIAPTSPMQPSAPALSLQKIQSSVSSETVMSRQSPNSETLRASHQPQVFSFPDLGFDELGDVISRRIIEFAQAEESVRFFQTKVVNFPFIVVPPPMTLDSLRRERPFLLLSILSFSAQSNIKLQSVLEVELRETLSRKVIVNGEKGLDLLQGILVYLTWYVVV